MSGGRRICLICSTCDEIFTRRVVDYVRTKGQSFCGRPCHAASLRTGRTMAEVVCWGCNAPFKKLASEMRRPRHRRNFCTAACYMDKVDRRALAAAGASAPRTPPPPAVRFLRSQKGGLARARNLTRRQLRRIAMQGVAARVAQGRFSRGPSRSIEARKIQAGLHFVGPLLQREEETE